MSFQKKCKEEDFMKTRQELYNKIDEWRLLALISIVIWIFLVIALFECGCL